MSKSTKELVSIAIATFNSERLLPKVFSSIERQTYPRNLIEMLVIDGGSSDNTLKLAKKHKARILENPHTDPVSAKHIALLQAKGKFLMYLDHDEVLKSSNSIEKKVQALLENPELKVVIGSNYVRPLNYPFISQYINEFGDPFSFFMYRLSKDARFFASTMKNRYKVAKETKDYIVSDLSGVQKMPLLEFIAGATMIDRLYFLKKYPLLKKRYYLVAQLYSLLAKGNSYVAVTKDDEVIHYSSDTLRKYLIKIDWRIRNNIYNSRDMALSGFSGRHIGSNNSKKFLFIPYALLILPAVLDSVYLIYTRREWRYSIHAALSFYTALMIVKHYIQKVGGHTPLLTSYDGSKIISQKT